MDWKEWRIKILKDSLYPIPSELNEFNKTCGYRNCINVAEHCVFARVGSGD